MGLFNKRELARINQLEARSTELEEELQSANYHLLRLLKYERITDIDVVIAGKRRELDSMIADHNEKLRGVQCEITDLQSSYAISYKIYSDLKKQIEIYNESIDLSEYGVYKPHFKFGTSDEFKDKILRVREQQKELIKSDLAVRNDFEILWGNSLLQGPAMVKREKKLMLRAFNGECDSFIASVEWNCVGRMIERIDKSFEAINKVYATQGIYITDNYKKLKHDELRLTYEYSLKKHEEKEEQRVIRELMREEEKV